MQTPTKVSLVTTESENGLTHLLPLVLSILVVNSDNFPPSDYDAVYKSAGLDVVSYTPTSASMPASQWPTLSSLIDSGKRLITFMDANANFTAVPYIIDGTLNLR